MTRRRVAGILLGALAGLAVLLYVYFVYPFWGWPFNASRHGKPPLTPAWALECWLWEDDVNTAQRVEELLRGYAEHDIPVRVILIDSPWSTRYNDFRVDTLRYPNPERWFRSLAERGYRVVLWMTSMVNRYNKDTAIRDATGWFEEARSRGYLAGNGHTVHWWKGEGGFIDYTNPEALRWWRRMQDRVLRLGIDGWKLDGTATLFGSRLLGIPFFYGRTHGGLITTRKYMDLYYRLEYQYGLSHNPEFVTLVRGIDRSYVHPEGFAPVDAAPVVWVGDQVHAWSGDEAEGKAGPEVIGGKRGLKEAIKDILLSAKLGYCVVGTDVAGFSGKDIPPRLYIRWAQFATFCGLFLNGGHGERRLWLRTPEELEIIRRYSWLHTELVPYMYSYVVRCHEGGEPLQRPLDHNFQYMFGDYLLVAPMFRDVEQWTVRLPKGRWRYFFSDTLLIEGPREVTLPVPLDEYPVFVREGAIIPLAVRRAYTGMGDRGSAGFTTLLIYPRRESEFHLALPEGKGKTTVKVWRTGGGVAIRLTGAHVPHILRVHLDRPPTSVFLDGARLVPGTDWWYDRSRRKLIVRTPHYERGEYRIRLRS